MIFSTDALIFNFLVQVITCLVERTPHIPYRESKLTRLLQVSSWILFLGVFFIFSPMTRTVWVVGQRPPS